MPENGRRGRARREDAPGRSPAERCRHPPTSRTGTVPCRLICSIWRMTVVLITGCSSGFGLLAALELARRGDRVFASMRDPARDATLKARAQEDGLDIE